MARYIGNKKNEQETEVHDKVGTILFKLLYAYLIDADR